MAVPVVMKSGKNYLTLVLDDEMEFPELLQEIIKKFRESEKFFGGEPIAIHFEGRKLTDTQQLQIVDAIDCYTSVRVATIVENSKIYEYVSELALKNQLSPKDIDLDTIAQEAVCTFIPRDIEAGEEISSTNTVVVLGNVAKGAIVRSNEHVIICGKLEGQALAGMEGDVDSVILAFVFLPENYRIGEYLGGQTAKKGMFSKDLNKRRNTKTAQLVYVEDGVLQIDDYKLFI